MICCIFNLDALESGVAQLILGFAGSRVSDGGRRGGRPPEPTFYGRVAGPSITYYIPQLECGYWSRRCCHSQPLGGLFSRNADAKTSVQS